MSFGVFFCQISRDVVVERGDDNPVGDALFPRQLNERIGGSPAPFAAVLDVDAVKIFSVRLDFIDDLIQQRYPKPLGDIVASESLIRRLAAVCNEVFAGIERF